MKIHIDSDRIQGNIVIKLHDWLASMPESERDKPMIFAAGEEGEAETPRDIVEQVDRGTEIGARFVQDWVDMAVEHIMESQLGVGSRAERSGVEDDWEDAELEEDDDEETGHGRQAAGGPYAF